MALLALSMSQRSQLKLAQLFDRALFSASMEQLSLWGSPDPLCGQPKPLNLGRIGNHLNLTVIQVL